MTRVRFDPTFIDDPRWERLGVHAYVLHSAACSYVVRSLTDGHVTAARVATLTPLVTDPLGVAQRLVDDGLWLIDGAGFHVCDCIDDLRTAAGRGDEQPSRAFVEAERVRSRERKARWKKNAEGNGVPNGSQSSGIAVQASPSPALLSRADEVNADRNAVTDERDAVGPMPRDLAERVRAGRRRVNVDRAKAVGE